MTKIVYNACYGGFSLSQKAIDLYVERKFDGMKPERFYDRDIPRNDQTLAHIVEELGAAADGAVAKLRIEDVPAGMKYRIDEYDGNERVMTVDDYDWSVA